MSPEITPSIGRVDEHVTIKQRAQMLEDCAWTAALSHKEHETLAQHMTFHQLEGETTIFREGEAGDFVCIVVSGEITVRKERDKGSHRELAVIGPGKAVGEMALIDKERRSATAIARVPSSLLILTTSAIAELRVHYPRLVLKLGEHIAKQLSQRLRKTSGELTDCCDDD